MTTSILPLKTHNRKRHVLTLQPCWNYGRLCPPTPLIPFTDERFNTYRRWIRRNPKPTILTNPKQHPPAPTRCAAEQQQEGETQPAPLHLSRDIN